MRFRAKLLDIVSINHFSSVVATLARNIKTCVLKLTPAKICFVISDRGVIGGTNVWCEIQQSNFFDDYKIEGKDESNEIYMEVNIEQLSRALKSSFNAQAVRIKLTKKQGALLTIEIAQPTLTGVQRTITHDLPVSMVPQRLWTQYQEPDMPDVDVSIYLPPLRLLRTVVDRMKAMGNHVVVSANMSGELQLKIETEAVTATTYFKDLQNHQFDLSSSGMSHDQATLYQARVDLKKFSQFLQGQFSPTKVICNVIDGRGLQLFLLHEDVSLQFYIPAVSR